MFGFIGRPLKEERPSSHACCHWERFPSTRPTPASRALEVRLGRGSRIERLDAHAAHHGTRARIEAFPPPRGRPPLFPPPFCSRPLPPTPRPSPSPRSCPHPASSGCTLSFCVFSVVFLPDAPVAQEQQRRHATATAVWGGAGALRAMQAAAWRGRGHGGRGKGGGVVERLGLLPPPSGRHPAPRGGG